MTYYFWENAYKLSYYTFCYNVRPPVVIHYIIYFYFFILLLFVRYLPIHNLFVGLFVSRREFFFSSVDILLSTRFVLINFPNGVYRPFFFLIENTWGGTVILLSKYNDDLMFFFSSPATTRIKGKFPVVLSLW